jgi:hypothetical protein
MAAGLDEASQRHAHRDSILDAVVEVIGEPARLNG